MKAGYVILWFNLKYVFTDLGDYQFIRTGITNKSYYVYDKGLTFTWEKGWQKCQDDGLEMATAEHREETLVMRGHPDTWMAGKNLGHPTWLYKDREDDINVETELGTQLGCGLYTYVNITTDDVTTDDVTQHSGVSYRNCHRSHKYICQDNERICMSNSGTLSWFRAVEQCENQLMKLAYVPLGWLDEVEIKTQVEGRQFIDLLQEDSYWVGFAGNPWVWTTTGNYITHAHWQYGAPNRVDLESCLSTNEYGTWQDISCHEKRKLICQSVSPSNQPVNSRTGTSLTTRAGQGSDDSLGICFHTTIGATTLDGSLDESSTVARQLPTIPNLSPPTVSPTSNSLDIDKESVGNTVNEQNVDNDDGFNNTSQHLPMTESTAHSSVGVAIGVSLGCIVFVLLLSLCIGIWVTRKKNRHKHCHHSNDVPAQSTDDSYSVGGVPLGSTRHLYPTIQPIYESAPYQPTAPLEPSAPPPHHDHADDCLPRHSMGSHEEPSGTTMGSKQTTHNVLNGCLYAVSNKAPENRNSDIILLDNPVY